MKKILLPFALALALVALAPAAFAGNAPANLSLTATVINNCTISTSAVAFGSYDPLSGSALTASGTVVVTCTKSAGPSITLGDGLYFSGTRRMKDSSTDYMTYEIYKPSSNVAGAACSYASPTRWGTIIGETFTPTAAPDKNARTYNVCGSIPAAQDLAAATFNDTVVATVNF